jgi:hypothetical protein
MSDDPLAEKMEDIALKLADQILSDTPEAIQSLDGFKALSAYYVATRKLGRRRTSDADDTDSFAAIRRRLSEVQNGGDDSQQSPDD